MAVTRDSTNPTITCGNCGERLRFTPSDPQFKEGVIGGQRLLQYVKCVNCGEELGTAPLNPAAVRPPRPEPVVPTPPTPEPPINQRET